MPSEHRACWLLSILLIHHCPALLSGNAQPLMYKKGAFQGNHPHQDGIGSRHHGRHICSACRIWCPVFPGSSVPILPASRPTVWPRVGQGLFWWQVCPATTAFWAGFWQGFPRQMYAKVLRPSSKCRVSLVTALGRAR